MSFQHQVLLACNVFSIDKVMQCNCLYITHPSQQQSSKMHGPQVKVILA